MVPTVIVTGFGPFRNHTENSSWLTAKELLNLNIKEYNVILKEIPVEYDAVLQTVPQLWKEFSPELTVHCGMSEQASCITIEKLACNKFYQSFDVKGNLPCDSVCCKDGPEVLHSAIDIEKVLKDVNSIHSCVKAVSSENAGKYLCEFIYYTSLQINKNTAFVHIPKVSKQNTISEMAKTLSSVISAMLKQVTH